jgi:hypothetical protein
MEETGHGWISFVIDENLMCSVTHEEGMEWNTAFRSIIETGDTTGYESFDIEMHSPIGNRLVPKFAM